MNYATNLDPLEVKKFAALATQWWENDGACGPLHVINPCRLQYILQHCQLDNKRVLDVGCGAGILSEGLAKHGAYVVGLDASVELINTAQTHALQANLHIEYQHSTIDSYLLSNKTQFDLITCMELLEHVPNPEQLITDCASLLKPGAKLFLSTINRNPKSYALAIIAAEYLLDILPRQTHDYKQFIQPAELAKILRNAGLRLQNITGIAYNALSKSASLSTDISINYICYATKEI